MSRAIVAIVVCVLACSLPVSADEIHLRNGDRLSGQIVRLTDGKLVFKSQLAGEVTVDLKDIRTFSSDTPVEIHLQDGTVLRQPVATAESNQFAIAKGETLRPQTFELGSIASIGKPQWQTTTGLPGATTSG